MSARIIFKTCTSLRHDVCCFYHFQRLLLLLFVWIIITIITLEMLSLLFNGVQNNIKMKTYSKPSGMLHEKNATILDISQSLQLPNAPILYLKKNKNKFSRCWKLAEIQDLKCNFNKHWQVLELSGSRVYLFSAYFDLRKV